MTIFVLIIITSIDANYGPTVEITQVRPFETLKQCEAAAKAITLPSKWMQATYTCVEGYEP